MPSCLYFRERGIEKWKRLVLICCLAPTLSLLHCAGKAQTAIDAAGISPQPDTGPVNFTVQVGAFSNPDNASKTAARLRLAGVDTYVFSSDNRLYKVRFGKYRSRSIAQEEASRLAAMGIVDEYLIVKSTHSFVPGIREEKSLLRNSIVETTKRFIGLPYSWGCASPKLGFDCSGLTMAVYRLNGLTLPRSSAAQWTNGTPVKRSEIKRGDLVFFMINGKGRISHVGIYMGNGHFVHAPGQGKNIRLDSLSNNYFKSKFAGARTYL